jgi:hypothetical protein
MGFGRVDLYVSAPLLVDAFKSDLAVLLVSPIMHLVRRNKFWFVSLMNSSKPEARLNKN